MKSKTTAEFKRQLRQLPKDIQVQAFKAYRLWLDDHQYPSLEFKKLNTSEPIYSVRIDRSYRALGTYLSDEDTILWFWIGHHSIYERILK